MLFHCEITLEIVEGWYMTLKYCPSTPTAKATSVMRPWDSDPLDSKVLSVGFLSKRMWNMLTFWACQLLCWKHARTMKDLAISADTISDRHLLEENCTHSVFSDFCFVWYYMLCVSPWPAWADILQLLKLVVLLMILILPYTFGLKHTMWSQKKQSVPSKTALLP